MKRIILGLALVLVLPTLALAQAKPAAAGQKLSLEFVDGGDLTVINADKSQLKFNVGVFEGDSIAAGATIITGKTTSAELKLVPNGSIIKLGKGATFAITALAAQGTDKNAFQVAAGKVKTIAAKGSNITVKTPTAVCGVRGTDFVVQVEDGKELLAVKQGEVAFSKLDAAGNAIGDALKVGAGMAADALAASFEAFSYPVEQYDQDFSDLSFQQLSETDVPQADAQAADEAAPAAAEAVVTEPATASGAADAVAEGAGKASESQAASGIMKWIQDIVGFELGSVTINGTTYSKAIIQPNFDFGSLKFGLYLPVIYSKDMFNPNDWYKPAGNNEWSFGTDKNWNTDPIGGVLDATSDLALKFKFLEFGRQLDDPFFVKVGNLSSLTIGHGLIMRNYNNNTEFPAVRRVGFNLGVDVGGFGFEALVNDLADPYIYGGRVYLRPIPGFKMAIGLSGAVDTTPAAALAVATRDLYGNPMFVSSGLDLDLPIIQGGGFLTIRAFADAAATTLWTRTAIGSNAAGLQTQLILPDGKTPQNWGAAAGLMGNILVVDYRFEYRYYTGFFKPSFYDTNYDKMRSSYAAQYYNYMVSPTSYPASPTVMGVYGEAGFSFIKDRLSFRLGYAMPWDASQGGEAMALVARSSDELHMAFVIKKGLIPIIDVAGSISYDRRGLAQALYASTSAGGGTAFQLIDQNTVFSGEIVIPVPNTPNLDVAAVFASVPLRNSDGTIKFVAGKEALGIPELRPSVTFETRFHF